MDDASTRTEGADRALLIFLTHAGVFGFDELNVNLQSIF